MIGLSRLYISRNFCLDSSLAFGLKADSLEVMSPGARCIIKNEMRLIPINIGIIHKILFNKYFSITDSFHFFEIWLVRTTHSHCDISQRGEIIFLPLLFFYE